jgi:cytochrome b pre-mRNA-processing protein 3
MNLSQEVGKGSPVARMNNCGQERGLRAWWRRRRAGTASGARSSPAWALYRLAVERARLVRLYAELGVPDTPDGRFEMIAIHTAIVMHRLNQHGAEGSRIARSVGEAMVADMDRSVRELGVGDLSVGKYVKRLAASLFARLDLVERTLSSGNRAPLVDLLRHKVFVGRDDPRAEALAADILAFATSLAAWPPERLLGGETSPPKSGSS